MRKSGKPDLRAPKQSPPRSVWVRLLRFARNDERLALSLRGARERDEAISASHAHAK
jgi:hypothetical protein